MADRWLAMVAFDAAFAAPPRVGDRVRIPQTVRDAAAGGAPGYGPLPGDAPGTVTALHMGIGAYSTTPRVQRVSIAWDDPGETKAGQTWRLGDLEGLPPPERADQ